MTFADDGHNPPAVSAAIRLDQILNAFPASQGVLLRRRQWPLGDSAPAPTRAAYKPLAATAELQSHTPDENGWHRG